MLALILGLMACLARALNDFWLSAGAHTSGRRQSYPGAAAHMAGGSSEYHPIIYSSSTENPAPQGPGQNLIGWLQRLVTRSARSTPTAEARPSQPFPHPEWI